MTNTQRRIVYCHCAYAQVVPADVKQDVLRQLTESGTSFDAVADLCEMAARRDPWLEGVTCQQPSEQRLTQIVACYPRAVKWLFSSAGAPLPEQGIEILNMRTESAEIIAQALGIAEDVTT
jgi:hypothetical protein